MIVVVGDIIVDEYVTCDVRGISQEAPIPILDRVASEYRPGGAANVAANIRSLGTEVSLIGAVGKDSPGFFVKRDLPIWGALFVDHRPTSVKTRFVTKHGTQVARVDSEVKTPIDERLERTVVSGLRSLQVLGKPIEAIVISDYGKGFVTDAVLNAAIEAGVERKIPVVVDPKRKDFSLYAGATAITPNTAELAATGYTGAQLALQLRTTIVETCDGDGARIWTPRIDLPMTVTAPRVQVADTTGAGDVFAAVLALALTKNKDMWMAVGLACEAASVSVTKRGTTIVTTEDLHG